MPNKNHTNGQNKAHDHPKSNELIATVETNAKGSTGEFSINLKLGPRPRVMLANERNGDMNEEVYMESGDEN